MPLRTWTPQNSSNLRKARNTWRGSPGITHLYNLSPLMQTGGHVNNFDATQVPDKGKDGIAAGVQRSHTTFFQESQLCLEEQDIPGWMMQNIPAQLARKGQGKQTGPDHRTSEARPGCWALSYTRLGATKGLKLGVKAPLKTDLSGGLMDSFWVSECNLHTAEGICPKMALTGHM